MSSRGVTAGSPSEQTIRRAAALVANLHGVDRAAVESGAVVVSLAANGTADRELVTEIVRQMLDARLAIDRVAPIESSLEERFLNIDPATGGRKMISDALA